jgi:outer membrane cobalamin receptor
VIGVLAVTLAVAGAAPRFRLLDAAGSPVPFARVALFGKAGAVATDGGGLFSLSPVPLPPFRLTVFSEEGEWLGIVRVDTVDEEGVQDLRLAPLDHLEVTVQTGLAPSTLAPPAAGATVLAREEQEQRQSSRVNGILKEVPGTGTIGAGHGAVPSVRGLARGRTLILLDDARITSERRAGVVYGSDALGGIIHGRTPVPSSREFGGRYEIVGGQGVGMGSGAFEVNIPAGGGGLLVQGHQRSFDDYHAPDGEVADSAARDRGFLIKGLVPAGRARWVLGLQVDESRDVGKPREAVDDSSTTYPEEDSARLTASALLPAPGALRNLEFHLFAGRYRLVTEREVPATSGSTGSFDRSEVESGDASVRLVASGPAGSGAIRFGLDASSRFDLSAETLSERTDPGTGLTSRTSEEAIESADRIDAGLFLEGEAPLARRRLVIAGGLRGQGVWSRNSSGLTGDESRSQGALTGYGAATAVLPDSWSVTLQAARGFREPTLSDRYFSGLTGRGFIRGNPHLDPESSAQFDLSLRRTGSRSRVVAYLYHYTITDLIQRFRRSSGDFAFRNRGEAEIQGVEVEAEREWGRGFHGRLTLSQARGTEKNDGEPLADIPPRQARLTFGRKDAGRVWWRLDCTYTWRDRRPGPAEAGTPGYALLDMAAGIRIHTALEVRLITSNLLDRQYPASRDDDSVPAPGMSAALVVAGRF